MQKKDLFPFRSKFWLNDEEYLTEILKNCGFEKIRFFRQDLPFSEEYGGNAEVHFQMPANKALLKGVYKKFGDKGVEEVKNEVRQKLAQYYQEGKWVGVEALVITAQKPTGTNINL